MLSLDTKEDVLVGGLGCEHCRNWTEYSSTTCELYGFVGKWGNCQNPDSIRTINCAWLTKNTDTNMRLNTHINRVSLPPADEAESISDCYTVTLSTSPTYNCPYYKGRDTSDRPTEDIRES